MTKPALAEIARQLACEFQPGAGGVARADDRDHRPHRRIERAAHAEQRGRVVQRRQPRRIAGFIRRHQADADLLARSQFSPRALFAADAPRRVAPPRRARSGSRSSAVRASPK